MFCSLTKEEAAAVNAISDQSFTIMNHSLQGAVVVTALTQLSPCHKSSALLHAALNVAMLTALGHRKAHEEMLDINSMGDLKKNPEMFLKLVEDVNEIFACICRGIDPEHDYMLNLFKMEKASKSDGDAGKEGEKSG